MKKGILICACIALTAFVLTACKKEEQVSLPQDGALVLTPELVETPQTDLPQWTESQSVICVLFGYGFNNSFFYDDAIVRLEKQFGLEQENGLVWPVLYPDDVKNRISNLYDMINARNIKGIVLLGAPENTHFMLARLQEFWDNDMPYPVFSLFPQDDMLGMEATCDFVLDYERTAEDEADTKEMEQTIDKTAEDILVNAIKYISELPERAHLPADEEIHAHVHQIVGKPVRRYTDSVTGLQAINHFVMETPKDTQEDSSL